jgi:hypothetical protein
VAAGFETNVPVAWKVFWSEREVGFAASIRTQGISGTTNLLNRVILEDVPLLDLVPALMRQVVGDLGRMTLDAKTRMEFDSLDNFSGFNSRVSINDISSVLTLDGKVRGEFLDLRVGFNDVTYSPKVPVPDQAALSETLFPDAKLPHLYVGRRWHEEVYSPFRSPNDPVETLEVEVSGVQLLKYGDADERVLRVEYRGSPGPGVPEEARLQAVALVRASDGLVLQQEVYIANSKLRFERLSNEEAVDIGRRMFSDQGFEGPRTWRYAGPLAH